MTYEICDHIGLKLKISTKPCDTIGTHILVCSYDDYTDQKNCNPELLIVDDSKSKTTNGLTASRIILVSSQVPSTETLRHFDYVMV